MDEESATASVMNVGTLHVSLEHDYQVVREVASGCKDLPDRRLLRDTVRPQRRELVVGQFGK